MLDYEAESLVHYNRATKYLESGRKDKALQFYKKSVKLRGSKEAYLNMGTIAQSKGDFEEADRLYRLSISEDPEYKLALNNLGLVEWYLGNDINALEYIDRAVEIDTDYHEARWNRALANLRIWCDGGDNSIGQLGWSDYDHRFIKKVNPTELKMNPHGLKYWNGKAKDGRIILASEQGMGDVIMFGRYAMDMISEGFDVVLQASPDIAELFPTVPCVVNPETKDYKYWAPICSLTRITGWTAKDPYIFSEYSGVEEGIGVCWHGNPSHASDKWRSRRESEFGFIKNATSLQYGEKSHLFKNVDLSSWKVTRDLIASLELIITVDTSIAHLAGAMGKETWVLQPKYGIDFRWGTTRKDCMWYSGVRNFHSIEELITAYKERYE